MLAFSGVVKRYSQPEGMATVLDGVDLQLAAGASAALLGERGGGKRTLRHWVNYFVRMRYRLRQRVGLAGVPRR